jgi:hypothetical protein
MTIKNDGALMKESIMDTVERILELDGLVEVVIQIEATRDSVPVVTSHIMLCAIKSRRQSNEE